MNPGRVAYQDHGLGRAIHRCIFNDIDKSHLNVAHPPPRLCCDRGVGNRICFLTARRSFKLRNLCVISEDLHSLRVGRDGSGPFDDNLRRSRGLAPARNYFSGIVTAVNASVQMIYPRITQGPRSLIGDRSNLAIILVLNLPEKVTRNFRFSNAYFF